MKLTDIHDYLFNFLLEERKRIPELVFRPRKTNRSNKLRQGYWFLGNDSYLTIGFWEGMDWKRKIPNIAFQVEPNGNSKIVFSASDSEGKMNFLREKILPSINSPSGPKPYESVKLKLLDISKDENYIAVKFINDNYEAAIRDFVDYYWPKINEAVKNLEYGKGAKLPIGLINDKIFKRDIQNILKYKEENEKLEAELNDLLPYKISQFQVENYGPIKQCGLDNIPATNQWIFLTGENGVGKSSIVKALAMAIAHRTMPKVERRENLDYQTSIKFHTRTGKSLYISRRGNEHSNRIKPYTSGFAAYGPFRLNPIFGALDEKQLKAAKTKTGRFRSLFDNDGYLLDLESEFKTWEVQQIRTFEKRKHAITELLLEALLNVQIIEFKYSKSGKPETLFYEEDGDQNLLPPVTIDKLSSGYKSIMAMMSDMLIRLFQQQPRTMDPAELEGVVFIDEIDIHLHPKFQKHLIEQLTAAFPNIQFIVTTHSPIPLLGAPKNSIICVVERDKENGVEIRRLDQEMEIENMLPNNILSSPIFGFKNLFSTTHNSNERVRTEIFYEEIKKNDALKDYLRKVAINLKKE